MATKDITDRQVLEAYLNRPNNPRNGSMAWPEQLLEMRTGQSLKVCYCAMERAARRELIDCGVSLRSGWITEKGLALLADIET